MGWLENMTPYPQLSKAQCRGFLHHHSVMLCLKSHDFRPDCSLTNLQPMSLPSLPFTLSEPGPATTIREAGEETLLVLVTEEEVVASTPGDAVPLNRLTPLAEPVLFVWKQPSCVPDKWSRGSFSSQVLQSLRQWLSKWGVPKALAAFQVLDSSGCEWLPDSGATVHITGAASSLQQTAPYNGSEAALVGNGNQLPITHDGSTVITIPQGNIPLLDVPVYPNIQKSLMSISKLCDDFPCGIFFDAKWVYVINLNNQRTSNWESLCVEELRFHCLLLQ